MVEADNAAKAVEKARPNREEAARIIRYHSSLHASYPLCPISKQCTVTMKETQRRKMTVTSSLMEMSTDQLGNRVLVKGVGLFI